MTPIAHAKYGDNFELPSGEIPELVRVMSAASGLPDFVDRGSMHANPDIQLDVIGKDDMIRPIQIRLAYMNEVYGPEVAGYFRTRFPEIAKTAERPGPMELPTEMPKRPPLGPNGR
ncbi:MAG: hypothetical protein SFX74_01835 [Fimbriimonadaceae bacterium]|nr:hypothetical protein [Fimbriimonadaceae bacterium]